MLRSLLSVDFDDVINQTSPKIDSARTTSYEAASSAGIKPMLDLFTARHERSATHLQILKHVELLRLLVAQEAGVDPSWVVVDHF